jgi:hypothetical protein
MVLKLAVTDSGDAHSKCSYKSHFLECQSLQIRANTLMRERRFDMMGLGLKNVENNGV